MPECASLGQSFRYGGDRGPERVEPQTRYRRGDRPTKPPALDASTIIDSGLRRLDIPDCLVETQALALDQTPRLGGRSHRCTHCHLPRVTPRWPCLDQAGRSSCAGSDRDVPEGETSGDAMNGMASFVPRGQVHVHGHTKNLADNLDGSCACDRRHVSAVPAVIPWQRSVRSQGCVRMRNDSSTANERFRRRSTERCWAEMSRTEEVRDAPAAELYALRNRICEGRKR